MNVRWLVVLGGVLPLGIVLACGNAATPPPEPPKAETAPLVDAAPVTVVVDAAATPAPVTAALLPSGDYEITTDVKKDTCSKADGGASAPDAVTLFVQMKIWHDKSGREKVTGNFPLPLPRAKGFGSARSDIVLSTRASGESEQASTLKGMGSQCPEYETKTLYRVLEQTENAVKVEYTRDYGDASKCPAKAQPPSKCALDYVYTFKLVNKVCDAHCGVTFAKGADGGLGPKCQSCDGGAP